MKPLPSSHSELLRIRQDSGLGQGLRLRLCVLRRRLWFESRPSTHVRCVSPQRGTAAPSSRLACRNACRCCCCDCSSPPTRTGSASPGRCQSTPSCLGMVASWNCWTSTASRCHRIPGARRIRRVCCWIWNISATFYVLENGKLIILNSTSTQYDLREFRGLGKVEILAHPLVERQNLLPLVHRVLQN